MRLVLGEFVAVRDLLVFESVRDLLLENFQLVLHLWVDISLRVWDNLAKRCVTDFEAVLCVVDFDICLALGRSVGELDCVVAKLDDLIAEQLLAALLASCSH